jgi:hypothetical protein
MLATCIDLQCEEAQSVILRWRRRWKNATLQSDKAPCVCSRVSEGWVCEMLAGFGSQLIKLAIPVWMAQADGL